MLVNGRGQMNLGHGRQRIHTRSSSHTLKGAVREEPEARAGPSESGCQDEPTSGMPRVTDASEETAAMLSKIGLVPGRLLLLDRVCETMSQGRDFGTPAA